MPTPFPIILAQIPPLVDGYIPVDKIKEVTWEVVPVIFVEPDSPGISLLTHENGGSLKGSIFYKARDLKSFLRKSYLHHKLKSEQIRDELEQFRGKIEA